ncbi:MAG: ATP-binding protein [Pseudomonadota bacterium]
MLKPALADNEEQRLRCLRTLQILDTPPDPALDAVTGMLAEQLGCPIALLTLVDEKRQWFKSRHGLASAETPREQAFCAHAILQHDQFLVPDAHQDKRFCDNPLVTGEPRVRFYAGQPLLVEGHAIGTLCVIDHQPREWSAAQSRLLARMATVVEAMLAADFKARESALAAARLQDLASAASSNLLWECDASLRLTWVGAPGDELFGSPGLAEPGQPLWNGRPLDELGRPQPEGTTLHAALRGAAGPVSGAFEVLTPAGPKTVGISAVPVVGRGRQHIGWRGVARDVGATVQARRRLRDAEEADARHRQQMALLSRVSHELRTPLNAMLSFNHLLHEELEARLAPHQRRWLDLVRQGGQHLLALTDDILTLGVREERPLTLAPLGLAPVIATALSFVGPLARAAQVDLQAALDADAPPALADERALHQVLLNVLGNAIKYSPADRRVKVRLATADAVAVIEVTDQGPGIPAARLDRLFLPFERLGAEHSAVPGTGLGLAIAKSLVEAMHGRIAAESPPEGGCRIRITLPLA